MDMDNGAASAAAAAAAASRDMHAQLRTPELQTTHPDQPHDDYDPQNGRNGGQASQPEHNADIQRSPSTPGHIPPFDWEEFETRYELALADMDGEEKELLEEFDRLVNYFNVWASAASAHDDERAVKRLQTRERYVKIEEQSLSQRKQHLTEVVRAFQSALALLSQT